MKILYITRHAKSSWSDPLLADFERPLNERGLRDITLMPDYFTDQGEEIPEYLITSSAKRAMQTAQGFVKEWNIRDDLLVHEKRLYHANVEAIQDVVFGLPNEYQRVMLFGHNPGITELANQFADHTIENVPTCGIIKLEADISKWNEMDTQNTHLTRFYFPKQFVK